MINGFCFVCFFGSKTIAHFCRKSPGISLFPSNTIESHIIRFAFGASHKRQVYTNHKITQVIKSDRRAKKKIAHEQNSHTTFNIHLEREFLLAKINVMVRKSADEACSAASCHLRPFSAVNVAYCKLPCKYN